MGICELKKAGLEQITGQTQKGLLAELKKVPVLTFILPSEGNTLLRTWGMREEKREFNNFLYRSLKKDFFFFLDRASGLLVILIIES